MYKPADKNVYKKQLLNCWKKNKDGAGFMFSDGNSLFIEKGFFRFRRLYKAFRLAERAYSKSSFVLHFRTLSSGIVKAENCHPFSFKEGRFGFAHNGTLTDWIMKDSPDSDTSNFTNSILEKLPDDFYDIIGLRFLIGKFASHHLSKFIFMNFKGETLLCNKSDWVEEKGVYFSNKAFEKTTAISRFINTSDYDWDGADYTRNFHGFGGFRCENCNILVARPACWLDSKKVCQPCYDKIFKEKYGNNGKFACNTNQFVV